MATEVPTILQNRQITDIEKAYIAALLDGEGTISIQSQGGRTARPIVAICNNNLECLLMVKELFGGEIYPKGIQARNKRWKVNSLNDVIKFLEEVLPFVLIKRRQAELALELAHLDYGGNSPESRASVEVLRNRLLGWKLAEMIKALNHV